LPTEDTSSTNAIGVVTTDTGSADVGGAGVGKAGVGKAGVGSAGVGGVGVGSVGVGGAGCKADGSPGKYIALPVLILFVELVVVVVVADGAGVDVWFCGSSDGCSL